MRKTLVAGLVAGAALTLLPLAPASANCDPDTGVGSGDCTNGCMQTGYTYEAVRAKLGNKVLPSYWDVFVCPQS